MNNLMQLLLQHFVIIPPIQRDYAQGRETGKIPHIRGQFIDNIVNVLSEDDSPIMELDFIYGYTEVDRSENREISIFKPLDGQQRLTTLFLIHWYVANKESKIENARPLLSKFSYATRTSSRSFCKKLIEFSPEFGQIPIDRQIIDQPWYYYSWQSDPTIQSMLVVLREIERKFQSLNNVWHKLIGENPRIVFHLLPMSDLGLPDDLYIKMNARGKSLTDFEQFKSRFSEILSNDHRDTFNYKIEKDWSDLFWNIFKEKNTVDIALLVDVGFLNFFWYITNLLIRKNGLTVNSSFWLDKINEVYFNSYENVKFLFDCLNLFESLEKAEPDYFSKIFYIRDEDFNITKTRLFFNNAQDNLFRKCSETYINGSFVIREQLLLYAFIQIKLNNKIVPDDFYRVTRNLLENASDNLIRNENLNILYSAIDDLIDGKRSFEELPFTKRQLAEEASKNNILVQYPLLKESVYKLEDHVLLRGNIDIFDFNESIDKRGKTFLEKFNSDSDYFEISKALLTFGFYPQDYGGGIRRFGNKNNRSWREILTQSENRKDYNKTKEILKRYLEYIFDKPGLTNNELILGFLNTHDEKDFIYYFIKYPSFSFWEGNPTDGYYFWENYSNKPYECMMLFKTNFRGRSWSPFLLELSYLFTERCTIENYSSDLQYTNGKMIFLIKNTNSGFKFSAQVNDEFSINFLNNLIAQGVLFEDGILPINQNESGMDLEDRIEKCKNFLENTIPDNLRS